MAAGGPLRPVVHLADARALALLHVGRAVREEAVVAEHVGVRVEEHAVGGDAVAPGAADLLVVRLERARHVAVDHVADVRLVDAHPERDRRDHDVAVVVAEGVLRAGPHVRLQPSVVGERGDPRLAQVLRGALGALP